MSNSVNLALDVTKTGIQNPLIKVRQGDGGFETLRTTVTANGEPMDLQGWTITFMGTTAGNHKIVDGNVTLVEAPNGIFDYTPSKAWGMDIGEFKIAYFKFVKGDGSASSANFRVSVIEAVDLTQEEAQNYISVVDDVIAEAREHLESSLADVSSSVAATSTAASSMAVFVSSTASSAVSQANSAASNASSVASSAVSSVASVASGAVSAVNAASNVYIKKSNVLPAEARDFNYLAKHMQTYQGFWYNRSESVANAPTDNWTYSVIEIIAGNSETTGLIKTMRFGTNAVYSANVNDGSIQRWALIPDDAQLVHKTRTETIDGDKTFTGKVTSSQPIDGTLSTRNATFTDFNDVAKNMVKYSGSWVIAAQSIANSPLPNYYTAIITPGFAGGTDGYIELVPFAAGVSKKYISVVGSGTLSAWRSFAFEDDVVHKTGTETIAGDKTFTGKVTADNFVSNSVPVNLTKTTTSNMWYSSTLTAYRTGNTVTIVNYMQAANVIPDNNNSRETIPAGYRPSTVLFYPVVYGSSLKGELQINTDGTFTARGAINAPYRVTATYITSDAWPV